MSEISTGGESSSYLRPELLKARWEYEIYASVDLAGMSQLNASPGFQLDRNLRAVVHSFLDQGSDIIVAGGATPPTCLALYRGESWNYAVLKTYREKDARGRPGSFLLHVIASSEALTPADVSEMYALGGFVSDIKHARTFTIADVRMLATALAQSGAEGNTHKASTSGPLNHETLSFLTGFVLSSMEKPGPIVAVTREQGIAVWEQLTHFLPDICLRHFSFTTFERDARSNIADFIIAHPDFSTINTPRSIYLDSLNDNKDIVIDESAKVTVEALSDLGGGRNSALPVFSSIGDVQEWAEIHRLDKRLPAQWGGSDWLRILASRFADPEGLEIAILAHAPRLLFSQTPSLPIKALAVALFQRVRELTPLAQEQFRRTVLQSYGLTVLKNLSTPEIDALIRQLISDPEEVGFALLNAWRALNPVPNRMEFPRAVAVALAESESRLTAEDLEYWRLAYSTIYFDASPILCAYAAGQYLHRGDPLDKYAFARHVRRSSQWLLNELALVATQESRQGRMDVFQRAMADMGPEQQCEVINGLLSITHPHDVITALAAFVIRELLSYPTTLEAAINSILTDHWNGLGQYLEIPDRVRQHLTVRALPSLPPGPESSEATVAMRSLPVGIRPGESSQHQLRFEGQPRIRPQGPAASRRRWWQFLLARKRSSSN